MPAVRFEDWVRDSAGPDWTITWSSTPGPKNESNHALDFPDSVDVRGDTKDGRYFRLSIGTTTNANQVFVFWLNGAANVQHGWVGLQHLSQLPRSLHRASQRSHASAGYPVTRGTAGTYIPTFLRDGGAEVFLQEHNVMTE